MYLYGLITIQVNSPAASAFYSSPEMGFTDTYPREPLLTLALETELLPLRVREPQSTELFHVPLVFTKPFIQIQLASHLENYQP